MIVNTNSIVQNLIQIENGIIKHVYKNYGTWKKDYSWNPSICICENDKYLKSILDTSVISCGEIISVMDIASTKMTNTIAKNVSINSDGKKVKYKIDSYILNIVLLVIILLLIVTIICYIMQNIGQSKKTLMH